MEKTQQPVTSSIPNMLLSENPSFYDLLEIPTDASTQEVRAAYLRAKAAYRKDSVALYSLMGTDETEQLLEKIEEAFQTLSNPERRRTYDVNFGLIAAPNTPATHSTESHVISIDRRPPMATQNLENADELLIPPSTDFQTQNPEASESSSNELFSIESEITGNHSRQSPSATPQTPVDQKPIPSSLRPGTGFISPAERIKDMIEGEKDFNGAFIKKIREAKRISFEELAEFTKISKTYLIAIEDDQYQKLPALVFVRGFISQIGRFLKLPTETQETLTQNYIKLYQSNQKAK